MKFSLSAVEEKSFVYTELKTVALQVLYLISANNKRKIGKTLPNSFRYTGVDIPEIQKQ